MQLLTKIDKFLTSPGLNVRRRMSDTNSMAIMLSRGLNIGCTSTLSLITELDKFNVLEDNDEFPNFKEEINV